MYPKIVFKNEQSKCRSSATATRNLNHRLHVIREENIEATGRRHVLHSRRSSTHPYASAISFNRIKFHSSHCDVCTIGSEYFGYLNTKISRIEELIESLRKTAKIAASANPENKKKPFFAPPIIFRSEVADFSKMSIDELVHFSNQLGVKLFGERAVNKPEDKEITPKVNNRMDISAIINSKNS